jgi:hypothetical protein
VFPGLRLFKIAKSSPPIVLRALAWFWINLIVQPESKPIHGPSLRDGALGGIG